MKNLLFAYIALFALTVDKNTALVIDNQTNIMATVKLKITGDVGLSMGYKR